MANWSYNGAVLPEFPTEYGSYTDKYAYRVIVYHESSQRWFARASAAPFAIGRYDNKKILYATDYYGDYYIPAGQTEWVHRGNCYDANTSYQLLEGTSACRVVWANHDVIDGVDGSLYLAENIPVSPDSVITKLTPNVLQLRLNRGEVFQFAAEVEGTEIYSKRVDYSLIGNDPKGGTTLSREGFLTVGAAEHASSFTVSIASRQDPSVVQTVTVTVVNYLSKLNLEFVTDLYEYNGIHMPPFPTYFAEYSDKYTYQLIVWEEKRQRWYAMASTIFTARKQSSGLMGITTGTYHGQYYLPLGGTKWIAVGYDLEASKDLTLGDSEWGYRMVWSNQDIVNRTDGSVYFGKSEPVRLCTPVTTGAETVYQIAGSTVWLNGTCVDLIEKDAVYTVKTWLYRIVDGLNTTLPPTWTSEVFGGPTWSQRLSLSGLMPFTRYGIYAVICVDGVATDHSWHSTFTSMQTDTEVGMVVEAEEVKPDGFTLSVTRGGLESATEYIAEVIVYHPDTSLVVFEGEMTFFGDGTDTCTVTGLEPGTRYAVSVDVYPAPAGAVVVRGDYFFTTAPEQTGWNIFAGVSGIARAVRAVYVGVNGRARRVKGVYVGVNGRAQPLRSK